MSSLWIRITATSIEPAWLISFKKQGQISHLFYTFDFFFNLKKKSED